MRAAFMTAVNEIEVREDASELSLDPAGAILRVEAQVICGTDARTFFNGDPEGDTAPQLGHEPVGVLEEVGPDADLPPGVGQGDRVFLGSILTCGEPLVPGGVPEPLRGPPALRVRTVPRRVRGARRRPAGRDEKNLIPLPPELPSDLATVADPFACALNGIEQLDVRLGDTVVILGTGPIGCWQAVMARDRGASKVYLRRKRRPAGDRARRDRPGGRRRLGRRRRQRRSGGPVPDRRRRRGARQRRRAGEAGPAGRAGDGGEAREGRLLRRSPSTIR